MEVLAVLVGVIGACLIIREFWCWFFKSNIIKENTENILSHLSGIYGEELSQKIDNLSIEIKKLSQKVDDLSKNH